MGGIHAVSILLGMFALALTVAMLDLRPSIWSYGSHRVCPAWAADRLAANGERQDWEELVVGYAALAWLAEDLVPLLAMVWRADGRKQVPTTGIVFELVLVVYFW